MEPQLIILGSYGDQTGARIERGTNVTVVRKGWGWVEVGHGGLYLISGNTEAGAFISRHITAEVFFFFFFLADGL